MKTIAIITGASGGLGKEFVALMMDEQLDEIWCVARNTQKLDNLKAEYGDTIVPFAFDLSKQESIAGFKETMAKEQPRVAYLINNAGMGETLGSYKVMSTEMAHEIIRLNCCSIVALCLECIPYMQDGARILNISSQSSFQPVPYLNLYAATKVFVRNYTRALNVELKGSGISATAVCPGWVDTDMLPQNRNGEKIKYPGLVPPKPVAVKALSDAKRNKDMSVYSVYVKLMHLLSKIYPQKTVMKTWVRSIRKYIETE